MSDDETPLVPAIPRITTVTTMGHAKLYVGLESEKKLLYVPGERKRQASLIHMAFINSSTDEGLRDTLRSITHQVKCDDVYGDYDSRNIPVKAGNTVVWLPDDHYDKIVRVLEKAGELGLAALMREGKL